MKNNLNTSTMKTSKFILLTLLLLSSLNLFSQYNLWYEKDFKAYSDYLSKEFGINCDVPDQFINLDKYYVMWKVRKSVDKHAGSLYGPMFISEDQQCLVMYAALPMDFPNNDMNIKKGVPAHPRSQITSELKTALGLYYCHGHRLNNNSATFDFNNYVKIVAGEKAKQMFNADSIYIYDIPGADSVYFIDESLDELYKEKYKFCTSIFLSKIDRVSMDIKVFFTPKGKKDEKQYIDMLNQKVWYNENFKHLDK